MQEYGGMGPGTAFLQKPFHLGDLAATIRELIEA
jgi:hypothetical protein